VAPIGGLQRPAHVTGAMADEWDRAVAAMPPGFYTAADVPVLCAYVEALAIYRKAYSILAKKPADGGGMEAKGSTGQTVAHPQLAVVARFSDLVLKAADRLGMSPTARTRLTQPDEEDRDETEQRYFGPN
jgi:P27 family predicted phage terminase small subunit